LDKQLVWETSVAHQQFLEREDSVERLVTGVTQRCVRSNGDLQVVQKLSQRRKRLATVTNTRHLLLLGLLQERKLKLKDIELENVHRQGGAGRERDRLRLADGEEHKRVSIVLHIVRSEGTERRADCVSLAEDNRTHSMTRSTLFSAVN
jgi:hypothetical protein